MASSGEYSSSTKGFFQSVPELQPLFKADGISESEDVTLPRLLRLYIPLNEQGPARQIQHLSERALDPNVLVHSVDAEVNRPVLRPFNTFGKENKNDPLWTTEGWKQLKRITHQEGLIAAAYEDREARYNRRINQFGLGHVWSCTSTMISCPMAMTDGAAKLLYTHLNDEDGDQTGRKRIIQDAYRRLISRDPSVAWTAGQWMTERSGGSDVSGTETVATRLSAPELETLSRTFRTDAHGNQLGPWLINGFKWFSSATDAELSLMLARTSKGLSLFMAPMRRTVIDPVTGKTQSELNGIRLQRLKDKLGTKALPTAELELSGVRAWLIGKEGQGVREISMILNLTRLHTAAGAVSGWSRALHVSRAYSKIRKVRGGFLSGNHLHLRWMASNTVRYRAAAQFTFFCIALLGALEQDWSVTVKPTNAATIIPNNQAELSALFRLLTPVLKAQVSLASVLGIREHMECLGGVGYCENNEDGGLFNIARIFRDTLVNPIWEGTVSVMAEDVVRVMTDKRIGGGKVVSSVFVPWAQRILQDVDSNLAIATSAVKRSLQSLIVLENACGKEELLYRGRELLEHLEYVACSVLLLHDAKVDQESVALAVAQRYIFGKSIEGADKSPQSGPWQQDSVMDQKIFLGASQSSNSISKL